MEGGGGLFSGMYLEWLQKTMKTSVKVISCEPELQTKGHMKMKQDNWPLYWDVLAYFASTHTLCLITIRL
jgi:hypothetical protein